jgi:hypothetical protein
LRVVFLFVPHLLNASAAEDALSRGAASSVEVENAALRYQLAVPRRDVKRQRKSPRLP